ncbi:MAG: hypothetical protein AAFV85_11120 [Cyanobacteria bacterium J06634_6]
MKFQSLAMIALTTCTLIVIGTGVAKAIFIDHVPLTTSAPTAVLAQNSPQEEAIPPEVEEINRATLAHLQEGQENSSQIPTVRRTVVDEGYALVTWIWGEAGGQSVLSLTDDGWQVIASGGGAVDVSVMEEAGVPTAIAQQLIESDQASW